MIYNLLSRLTLTYETFKKNAPNSRDEHITDNLAKNLIEIVLSDTLLQASLQTP